MEDFRTTLVNTPLTRPTNTQCTYTNNLSKYFIEKNMQYKSLNVV